MAKVEVYTTRYCPYCIAAKKLLDAKGVAYQEKPVDDDPEARRALALAPGRAPIVEV